MVPEPTASTAPLRARPRRPGVGCRRWPPCAPVRRRPRRLGAPAPCRSRRRSIGTAGAGLRGRTGNVRVLPSGDRRAGRCSRGLFVTCRSSEPSTPTRQIRPSGWPSSATRRSPRTRYLCGRRLMAAGRSDLPNCAEPRFEGAPIERFDLAVQLRLTEDRSTAHRICRNLTAVPLGSTDHDGRSEVTLGARADTRLITGLCSATGRRSCSGGYWPGAVFAFLAGFGEQREGCRRRSASSRHSGVRRSSA